MIKKIVLVIFVTIFFVLQGTFIRGKDFELTKAKKKVESLFCKSYTSANCELASTRFKRNRVEFIIFNVTTDSLSEREFVLQSFSTNLPKFFKHLPKQIKDPKSCILVWCTEPTIRFKDGQYYGRTSGFVVIDPFMHPMFVKDMIEKYGYYRTRKYKGKHSGHDRRTN